MACFFSPKTRRLVISLIYRGCQLDDWNSAPKKYLEHSSPWCFCCSLQPNKVDHVVNFQMPMGAPWVWKIGVLLLAATFLLEVFGEHIQMLGIPFISPECKRWWWWCMFFSSWLAVEKIICTSNISEPVGEVHYGMWSTCNSGAILWNYLVGEQST